MTEGCLEKIPGPRFFRYGKNKSLKKLSRPRIACATFRSNTTHRRGCVYRMHDGMSLGDMELSGIFILMLVICVTISLMLTYLEEWVARQHIRTQICANTDTQEEFSPISNSAHVRHRRARILLLVRCMQGAGPTVLPSTDKIYD